MALGVFFRGARAFILRKLRHLVEIGLQSFVPRTCLLNCFVVIMALSFDFCSVFILVCCKQESTNGNYGWDTYRNQKLQPVPECFLTKTRPSIPVAEANEDY